jgi:hypothetical protein
MTVLHDLRLAQRRTVAVSDRNEGERLEPDFVPPFVAPFHGASLEQHIDIYVVR